LGLDLAVEETLWTIRNIRPWSRKLQLGLDLAVEETRRQRLLATEWWRRFNWASTSRSRKQRAQRTSGNALASLQLGLDLAVEETLKDAREAKLAIALQLGLDLAVEETPRILARPGMSHVASIGPRPRGRGNS